MSELLKTPLHDLHVGLGAKMVPFAGYDMPVQYPLGVMKEHNQTRTKAGLFDVSHMGQVRIDGAPYADLAAALETMLPVNAIDLAEARQRYGFFTNDVGGIEDDLMFANRGDHIFMVVNAACKDADIARLKSVLEPALTVTPITDRALIALQGPSAEAALATLNPAVADMKFMDVRRMCVGMADCIVQRVSYTGDLGFEIYCDAMAQRQLWWTLWNEGQAHGMQPFGMRAMMSLRLDKFFGSWLSEFSPDYTAAETGMARFISFKKNVDFIGRAAAEAERATPPARQLCAFEIDADDADVVAYEPIWIDGTVQGFCTSGGYSHYARKSIAQALIPRNLARNELEVEIEILGKMCKARLITEPLFDADGARMRG